MTACRVFALRRPVGARLRCPAMTFGYVAALDLGGALPGLSGA
jgi:hypothetical protein